MDCRALSTILLLLTLTFALPVTAIASDPVLLTHIDVPLQGSGCVFVDVVNSTRFFDYGFTYGFSLTAPGIRTGRAFRVGQTGSMDFTATTAGFADVVSHLINGADESFFITVSFRDELNALVAGGGGPSFRESEKVGRAPDLLGSTVSLIRLIVINSALQPTNPVATCAPSQFAFSYRTDVRWEIWGTPPIGPPPAPPSITVLATGCTTCHTGDLMAFIARLVNPGPSVNVQVKGGARLPDGSIIGALGHDYEATLTAGQTLDIPIAQNFPTPAVAAAIDVTIEAAILEPELGVTISRHNVIVHVQP